MGFSTANYMLQEAYHKLRWSVVEKKEIIGKLEAAGIEPPDDEKFDAFCRIYTSHHNQFMQAYEARTTDVPKFLISELDKTEESIREILKEIQDDKRRAEQDEFDQKEHLRALKLEEEDILHYKQMQEKLDREYQEWKKQQEAERKEKERLLALITTALNELFSELLQSDDTYDFLFDGHAIKIDFSDVYRQIQGITRDYFNLALHEEDYIESRASITRQIISNKIDEIIDQRPRAEHARLLALKDERVISETNKFVRAIDQDMRARSAYDKVEEAKKLFSDNFGVTHVKRANKEVSKKEEVVSKEEEVINEKEKTVSAEKEAVNAEKEAVSAEKEAISAEKEAVSAEKEAVSAEKEIINAEKEIVSEAKIETTQEEEKVNKIEKEIEEEKIKVVAQVLEQKTKEKSSETQIVHAALEAQILREESNDQMRDQHIQDMADILKGLQSEEKTSPPIQTKAVKTDPSKMLPKKSLFPLMPPPGTSRVPPKNDPAFSEEPQQAGAAPVRKRRF